MSLLLMLLSLLSRPRDGLDASRELLPLEMYVRDLCGRNLCCHCLSNRYLFNRDFSYPYPDHSALSLRYLPFSCRYHSFSTVPAVSYSILFRLTRHSMASALRLHLSILNQTACHPLKSCVSSPAETWGMPPFLSFVAPVMDKVMNTLSLSADCLQTNIYGGQNGECSGKTIPNISPHDCSAGCEIRPKMETKWLYQ